MLGNSFQVFTIVFHFGTSLKSSCKSVMSCFELNANMLGFSVMCSV